MKRGYLNEMKSVSITELLYNFDYEILIEFILQLKKNIRVVGRIDLERYVKKLKDSRKAF